MGPHSALLRLRYHSKHNRFILPTTLRRDLLSLFVFGKHPLTRHIVTTSFSIWWGTKKVESSAEADWSISIENYSELQCGRRQSPMIVSSRRAVRLPRRTFWRTNSESTYPFRFSATVRSIRLSTCHLRNMVEGMTT